MPITYDAGTNTITVTGYTEATPCTFLDIYNADVAGGWGVVSRQCENQFCFDAGLIVGDGTTVTWFADTNKQVQFNVFNVSLWLGGYYGAVRVNANANFRLGEILAAAEKIGVNGCACYFNASPTNRFAIIAHESGNLKLYSSYLSGTIIYGSGGGHTPVHTGNLTVWNTILEQAVYVYSANTDLDRVIINRKHLASYGLHVDIAGPTITRPSIFGAYTQGAFTFYSSGVITVKNAYIRDCANIAILWGNTGTYNIINADTDVWTIYRYYSGSEIIYRQYELDLKVQDKDENAISGATVKIWDVNSNLVVDTTTNASGEIPTQILNYGYYSQAGGNTPNMQTPHTIEISKAGYQTYKKKFTVDEKIDWRIRLKLIQINIDNEVIA